MNKIKKYQILQETENYYFEFIHPMKEIIVRADREKIAQVIYNLVNNAINYTGDDKLNQ